MKRDLSVRAYREGDEEGIYTLWKVIHPEEHRDRDEWMRWWHWIHKKNPAGEGLIRLAEANGRIVAHHMMVPIKYKINGQISLCGLGTEAMTHPDYRRRGLWKSTTEALLSDSVDMAISAIGTPNKLSHAAWSKVDGFFKVSTTKVMVKPLNWKNFIRLKIKNKLLSRFLATGAALVFDKIFFRTHKAPEIDGLAINRITSFDERFDRLWDRVPDRYPIMTVRNKDYLNWRYNTPGMEYSIYAAEEGSEVRGYLVLSDRLLRGARVSYVADMIAESEAVMHCLVSKAVEECHQSGIDFISYSLIANKAYHRALRKNGFLFYPLMRDSYLGIYSNSKKVSQSYLQNPKNWLFQHGDTDTI